NFQNHLLPASHRPLADDIVWKHWRAIGASKRHFIKDETPTDVERNQSSASRQRFRPRESQNPWVACPLHLRDARHEIGRHLVSGQRRAFVKSHGEISPSFATSVPGQIVAPFPTQPCGGSLPALSSKSPPHTAQKP